MRRLADDLGSHCLGGEGRREGYGLGQPLGGRLGGRPVEGAVLSRGFSAEEREKSGVEPGDDRLSFGLPEVEEKSGVEALGGGQTSLSLGVRGEGNGRGDTLRL